MCSSNDTCSCSLHLIYSFVYGPFLCRLWFICTGPSTECDIATGACSYTSCKLNLGTLHTYSRNVLFAKVSLTEEGHFIALLTTYRLGRGNSNHYISAASNKINNPFYVSNHFIWIKTVFELANRLIGLSEAATIGNCNILTNVCGLQSIAAQAKFS
jgi:hypothetical protein